MHSHISGAGCKFSSVLWLLIQEYRESGVSHFLSSGDKRLDPLLHCLTKVPFLTHCMHCDWLNFANQYKKWTAEDWNKVMWSNKSSFQCGAKQHQKLYRTSNISTSDTRYVHTTVQHPDSIMAWGASVLLLVPVCILPA